MPIFQATIQHDDKTFETLAHMQYDLFCKSNRVARTILSIAAILFGIANYESWWGILVIGYGCYLTTSTYSSANHTAHKLSKGIRTSGMQFPSSRYEFTDEGIRIISLPEQEELGDPLGYSTFEKLGEDWGYFYLFPNPHGGYMIPKTEIEDAEAFRKFIQHKTGKTFQSKMPPVAKLLKKLKDREQAPYHL
jgi:hypothetical protein